MRATNRLIAGFFVVALSCAPLPSFAGLGEAEGGTKTEFSVYCGKRGNNCKVLFTEDKLIVNGKDSIARSQIIKYTSQPNFKCWVNPFYAGGQRCAGEGTVLVLYSENGKEGSGTFLFANEEIFRNFVNALDAFCGADCRPIGPSIKLEQ